MRKRVLSVLLTLCMVLCLVLFAGCAQQQLSTAERTEVRNSGTAIQWKYSDKSDWHDLVTIAELRALREKMVPTVLTAPSIYAQHGNCRNHAAFHYLKDN